MWIHILSGIHWGKWFCGINRWRTFSLNIRSTKYIIHLKMYHFSVCCFERGGSNLNLELPFSKIVPHAEILHPLKSNIYMLLLICYLPYTTCILTCFWIWKFFMLKIFQETAIMIEIISVALGLQVDSLLNMINITGIWKLLFLSYCSFQLVKLVFWYNRS